MAFQLPQPPRPPVVLRLPCWAQAVVSGTASSGLLICLLRVGTKLLATGAAPLPIPGESGGPHPQLQALRAGTAAYFALSAVLCAAGVVVHVAVLPRLRVVRMWRAHTGLMAGGGWLGHGAGARRRVGESDGREGHLDGRRKSGGGLT